LLGRLLTRARFRENDLVEERRVVLDELFRARSDPEQTLERQVGEQLWGESWHLRDIAGDSASLNAITLDQLEANFERYYIPNNSALIVTGDISPAEVFRDVERRFGDWERGIDPLPTRTTQAFVPLGGSRAVVVGEGNIQDVTVSIALHGPSLQEDTSSTYAADALLAVLNESSSKFQKHLVGSGLFQWVDVEYRTLREPSAITFRAKTTVELAEHAVVALVSALDQAQFLLDLTPEDLAIAQRARELDMALTVEASAGLAPSLAIWWASAGIDYYLSYDVRLNVQTLSDLRHFADAYVLGRPKVIGVLAPPSARNRIASWLQGASGSRP
jgi:zinc protease